MHGNLLWLGVAADVVGVEEFESVKVSKGTIDQSENFLEGRVFCCFEGGKTISIMVGQLHHLLQCLHPIGIARARRAPAGLPTGRRDQASEPGKLEACKPLRGLQLPGYRRWSRPPGIGQSLGGSPR
jgi:hypothetical protein